MLTGCLVRYNDLLISLCAGTYFHLNIICNIILIDLHTRARFSLFIKKE